MYLAPRNIPSAIKLYCIVADLSSHHRRHRFSLGRLQSFYEDSESAAADSPLRHPHSPHALRAHAPGPHVSDVNHGTAGRNVQNHHLPDHHLRSTRRRSWMCGTFVRVPCVSSVGLRQSVRAFLPFCSTKQPRVRRHLQPGCSDLSGLWLDNCSN